MELLTGIDYKHKALKIFYLLIAKEFVNNDK